MMSQLMFYYRISEYVQAYRNNVRSAKDADDMVRIVNENRETSPELTIYEFLTNMDARRVYFDIENIPRTQPETIEAIIPKLAEFFGMNPDTYALTLNEGSHHPGLSYHLVFPYVTSPAQIRAGIRAFKIMNPEYMDFIDERVYNRGRLFRLPYQQGLENTVDRKKDVHLPIVGNTKDFIVQDIEGYPLLEKHFEEISDHIMPETGGSKDTKFNKRHARWNNNNPNYIRETNDRVQRFADNNTSRQQDDRLLEVVKQNNRASIVKDIIFGAFAAFAIAWSRR